MRSSSSKLRLAAITTAVLGTALVGTSASSSPTLAEANGHHGNGITRAHAVIKDVNGKTIGNLTLQQSRGVVSANVWTDGLTAGFHGFHIHTAGVCDPKAVDPNGATVPFFTAGGHFDLAGGTHSNHAGDLPPLLAHHAGHSRATVSTDRFNLDALFDKDGSAIIVHAGPDNLGNIPARYTSSTTGQPGPDAATLATGDAGGRFGCGVITR